MGLRDITRFRLRGIDALHTMLMFGVSYTWAKSMDDSSNYRDIVPDTYNTTNLWAPSEYDARHAAGGQLSLCISILQWPKKSRRPATR